MERRLKAWHEEEWHTPKARIIRDIVYAIDTWLVTTVSLLAGVTVSLIAINRIILAGLIDVTAGTLAIFFGSYISCKAQRHFFENRIEREKMDVSFPKRTWKKRGMQNIRNFSDLKASLNKDVRKGG